LEFGSHNCKKIKVLKKYIIRTVNKLGFNGKLVAYVPESP
jgi:hypothetical protein